MDIASAEVSKYVANSYLAMRITYMNEVANFCEVVGADVDLVRRGIGNDSRIGKNFYFLNWIWWLLFSKRCKSVN